MRGKGEGSVSKHKRPDGRWEGRLDLGYVAGKRKRLVFYGHTKSEVIKKIDNARGKLKDGLVPPPARYTVGQLLEDWLADASPARSARTMERYRTVARLHLLPNLGRVRLADIGPQHVEALQRSLIAKGLQPRTVIKVRNVLSGALSRAERWRLIARNPVELAESPRVQQSEARTLSRADALRFVVGLRGDRLEALYLVVIALGVRRGEALGLRWTDIDWETGAIDIRRQLQRVEHGGGRQLLDAKTRAGRRRMYLPPIALEKLREHQERQADEKQLAAGRWLESGLVFPSTVGTPMEPRNLNRAWYALRKRLDIPDVKLHELRHSATSLYLALGVPPHVVQAIMGHSDPKMTLAMYAHTQDDDRRYAAELMGDALRGSVVNWSSKRSPATRIEAETAGL